MANAEPVHEIPEHLKRECARCSERRERYERAAAGHGTIDEIREALNALEVVHRQGLRLGQKVKIDGGWYCPRCTTMRGTEDVPLISVAPNRRARRAKRTKVRPK